jgi:enoyl-CoA hydratase/carnithine racemase
MSGFETIEYDERDHVAFVTMNRPDVHNAFNQTMQAELQQVWRSIRDNDDVRVAVLTGAGDRAFCTGIDRADIATAPPFDPFTFQDPGRTLGPKSQGLWKPVIAAINGMACGGAFYLIGESDIVIAADHATFFDPHVTYGMTAVYEPALLMPRMAFGDLVRMSLTGVYERLSAQTARESGLVTEVVAAAELLTAATRLAADIAAQPPVAVQATLRTLWALRDLSPGQGLELGNLFLQLGTSRDALDEGQEVFNQARPKWRVR